MLHSSSLKLPTSCLCIPGAGISGRSHLAQVTSHLSGDTKGSIYRDPEAGEEEKDAFAFLCFFETGTSSLEQAGPEPIVYHDWPCLYGNCPASAS